jgi:PDZ domain-containing protein
LRGVFRPWRVLGAIVLVALALGVLLYTLPSGTFPHQLVGRKAASSLYILLPDTAHPVAPLVKVAGAHPSEDGTLYFVDVLERRANTLDVLLPWLHPHATFLPTGVIVPPCASEAQANAAALEEMSFSQRVAAAVALRKLGYHVVIKPTGVVVSQLIGGTHAPCNLQPQDVVIAVDGTPTPTETALHAALGRVQPGATVKLRVRRGERTITVPVRTVRDPRTGRALVGFVPDQSARIKLPIKVAIDTSGIGGPSAGLAFTLEVMQKLGRNVLHGHKVAATGEMQLNGQVAPIGGIKQKTYGVRQAGANVFLVPAGQNARDARKYAGPVRVIPVHNINQALRALATLPRS